MKVSGKDPAASELARKRWARLSLEERRKVMQPVTLARMKNRLKKKPS